MVSIPDGCLFCSFVPYWVYGWVVTMKTNEEFTTIQLNKKSWLWLVKLKYDLGCKDYSEVLEKLNGLVVKFKLAKELK